MDNAPSPASQTSSSAAPDPEVLKPRVADETVSSTPAPAQPTQPLSPTKPPKRRTYRPSHRATFIGLGVVGVILAVNAAVLGFVVKKQAKQEDLFNKGQVSISTEDLNKLGINRSVIGNSGVELVVAPDAQFKGKLAVAGDTSISGAVVLNSKFKASEGNVAQLQAGNTALAQLNVNGKSTLSDLNLRKNLVVTGITHLQGPSTFSQAVAINNSLTITGNLVIGGKLTVSTFSVRHFGSTGSTPNVGKGSDIGSNGTVSISGNDTAGTVVANTGVGGGSGTLVNVAFNSQYSSAPKVVISPVGVGGSFYVTNITVGGFSIGISSNLSPGQYKFNYIVIQ